MIDTPFDDIAVRLSEYGMNLRGNSDAKLIHCNTFVQVCRVRYLQIYEASDKSWKRNEALRSQLTGTRSISTKEMIDHSLELLEIKLSYFGFIEEINRFGRVFESEYNALIPAYYRVNFYRNKMIEHWDDFESYLQTMGNGYMGRHGMLIVPAHFGAINEPVRSQSVYDEMSQEFGNLGVVLPPLGLDLTADYKYSETLFSNLERIDLQLRRGRIPDTLVNTLFKYSFPLPIYDLQTYLNELVTWLENFTLAYQLKNKKF